MARKAESTHSQEISDLRDRADWLDQERRRLATKLSQQEQQLALRQRESEGREQRIQALEQQLRTLSAQVARVSNLDAHLAQFKDEVVKLLEQYDQRRIRADEEIDRLRRVEHEVTAREIADMRKELPAIGRLQKDIELRVAEEARLTKLIGEQKNRLSKLDEVVEAREQVISFLNEKEKQNSRNIAESKTALLETTKQLEQVRERLETGTASVVRFESKQEDVEQELTRMRKSLSSWIEQLRIGEYERNQRIESWERERAEHLETLQKYSQDWITFSDQYKEAKMAVETLSDWQQQLEQQQRDATQLLKVEFRRLQSLWDDFELGNENKWKNFRIEEEQRWATVERHDRKLEERIEALDEMLASLEQEKDLIRRIQAAQTDAIKRLPLMWMEEVEKAIAQNPHRRRQPALVPVNEE